MLRRQGAQSGNPQALDVFIVKWTTNCERNESMLGTWLEILSQKLLSVFCFLIQQTRRGESGSWHLSWVQKRLYPFVGTKNSLRSNKIFSRTQPRQLVAGRNRRFGNHLVLVFWATQKPHHPDIRMPVSLGWTDLDLWKTMGVLRFISVS
jgi:hypothetical protein